MRISDWSSDVCSSDLAAAGFVDRVVVEHREEGFRRLRPARPGGPFGVVAQDFAHVVEVVVRPRRFGVGGLPRGELLLGKLDWRDRGHGSGGWDTLQIGRAPGRERGWQLGESTGVAGKI